MAGHSKFANIKHKKAKTDAAKGKVFTKLGREIAVAVKFGGPDPAANMTLRDVIAKAKRNNMPNETIERSVKKAAGEGANVDYEAISYEGYGPNGVAVIVGVLTDNKNRAAANVRNAFTKGGGNMGQNGCVSFMFDKRGLIMIEREKGIEEDELMMLCLDAGAMDFAAEDEGFEIITEPDGFNAVLAALEASGFPKPVSAEITMIPQVSTALTSPDDIKKMNKLLDLLDDEDDVQDVYHNWEDR
jgi:YebC/PmpR family DNA-binding regulatory protein